MELYHLDWEAERAESPDRLLGIIVPPTSTVSFEANVLDALKRGTYRKVATITGYRLDEVFRLTQNLDESWTEANVPGVEPHGETPARSTSVGDLIRDDDGKYHAVATFGLVRVEPAAGPAN